jgi:hypothetical protein
MFKEVIDLLSEASLLFSQDGETLRQRIYLASDIEKLLPREFISIFKPTSQTVMGLEILPANTVLGIHTDFKPRISNLIVNVNDFDVTVSHSNSGTLLQQTIKPNDHLLIDVTKDHGCEVSYPTDVTLLSINYNKSYDRVAAWLSA